MAPAQVSALDPILGTEDALPATHDDEVVVGDLILLQEDVRDDSACKDEVNVVRQGMSCIAPLGL